MLSECIRDEAVELYVTLIQSKNTGRMGLAGGSGRLMEAAGQSVETTLAEVLVVKVETHHSVAW